MRRAPNHSVPAGQRGAALVEFALVAVIFFFLLIAIFEFGRLMFTWNSAAEATRRGARLAVVCDLNAAQIKAQMRSMLPVIADSDIDITYSKFDGSSCSVDSCEQVTVSILPDNQTSKAFQYYIPIFPDLFDSSISVPRKVPQFSTTLTRESLSNGSSPDNNCECTNTCAP